MQRTQKCTIDRDLEEEGERGNGGLAHYSSTSLGQPLGMHMASADFAQIGSSLGSQLSVLPLSLLLFCYFQQVFSELLNVS